MNPRLQILICTIGEEGMRRILQARHPVVEGVEYLVALQTPDGAVEMPDGIASRSDFKVITHATRGLSLNRNFALEHASAQWCLISDDDVDYSPEALAELLSLLGDTDADIITLRSTCNGRFLKPYPESACPYSKSPKGYYATSFEIAIRRERVAGRVRFNEMMGIGAPVLKCGEEDIFLDDALRAGFKIQIYPLTICAHDHATTSERDGLKDYFIMTRGAVHSRLHPFTWPLRILLYAMRERHKISPRHYIRMALAGRCYARQAKIFG